MKVLELLFVAGLSQILLAMGEEGKHTCVHDKQQDSSWENVLQATFGHAYHNRSEESNLPLQDNSFAAAADWEAIRDVHMKDIYL